MEDMPDFEQISKIINAVKTAKMLGEVMQGSKENSTEPVSEVKESVTEPVSEVKESSTELVSEVKESSPEPVPQVNEQAQPGREITLCAFDRELQSPAIRSIKAAIPYLDYKYQRNMGIIVKLMEMDRLINHYTVLATESGKDKSREMLLAVKNELPEQSRPAADLLMKIMEIKDITASIAMQDLT